MSTRICPRNIQAEMTFVVIKRLLLYSFIYQAIYTIYSGNYTKASFYHHIESLILNMCKGAEPEKQGGFCSSFPPKESATTTGSSKCCELCGLQASLYCQADDAYLCRKCDKWVHGANFLALRHIRCFLCNTCQNLTRRYLIGASVEVVLPANVSWSKGNLPNNSTLRKCSRMH